MGASSESSSVQSPTPSMALTSQRMASTLCAAAATEFSRYAATDVLSLISVSDNSRSIATRRVTLCMREPATRRKSPRCASAQIKST